jgi:bifunctional non-homologous end joining protein LigD
MKPMFVVQEHLASRLHWDFRLEREGVLKSWAIPKGPSMDPAQRRLAIMVDDHEIGYADYEGIIPEGNYGAGAVATWDRGTYEELAWEDERITFVLAGNRLAGEFTLVRLSRGKPNEWLLIKKKDEHAVSGWQMERALTREKLAALEVRDPGCDAQ